MKFLNIKQKLCDLAYDFSNRVLQINNSIIFAAHLAG